MYFVLRLGVPDTKERGEAAGQRQEVMGHQSKKQDDSMLKGVQPGGDGEEPRGDYVLAGRIFGEGGLLYGFVCIQMAFQKCCQR